jgi:hypothetical protein
MMVEVKAVYRALRDRAMVKMVVGVHGWQTDVWLTML